MASTQSGTRNESGCNCTKRSAWICVFLGVLVFAFTAQLLAILTPSWQFVYLEDGRTEHHHGLWLDCKRDYSNEYGRPHEYYESLYRINHLQNPFDQFWLPHLQCVYKFDYWIDDEDWYEHGYDENRLQGDAYQHLFIGWKIAALTAHGFALVCSLNAIFMLLCGFCHRLLICVAAVLTTLSVVGCAIGNVVFYMFASYQDNNIIKEDDGIYEQYFGWSFYASLIANVVLLITSIIGCNATSAVFTASRTQLVKIEVDEAGDEARLLRLSAAHGKKVVYVDGISEPQSSFNDLKNNESSNSRFRRSRSVVYKIDSSALRKWERETMRNVALRNSVFDFKRANSLPNIAKKSEKKLQSNSRQSTKRGLSNSDFSNTILTDISCTIDPFQNTTKEFIPSQNQWNDDLFKKPSDFEQPELIYECVDENASPYEDNTSSAFASKFGTFDKNCWQINKSSSPIKSSANLTTMNTYDKVPIRRFDLERDDYLKPKSMSSENNSQRSSFNGASSFLGSATFTSTNYEIEKKEIEDRTKVKKEQNTEEKKQDKIDTQILYCNKLQQKQEKFSKKEDNNERAENERRNAFQNRLCLERKIFESEQFFTADNSLLSNTKNGDSFDTGFTVLKNRLISGDEIKNGVKVLPNKLPQRMPLYQNSLPSAPYLTLKNKQANDSTKKKPLQINTFQTESYCGTNSVGEQGFRSSMLGKCSASNRSLVNLVSLSNDEVSTVSVFDRGDLIDFVAELDAAISTPTKRNSVICPQSSVLEMSSKNNDLSNSRSPTNHQYFDSTAKEIKETNFNGSRLNSENNYIVTPTLLTTNYKHHLKSSILTDSELDRSFNSITSYAFQNQGIYEDKPPSVTSFRERTPGWSKNVSNSSMSEIMVSNLDSKRLKKDLSIDFTNSDLRKNIF